jgi:hypothetical protein
MITKRYRDEEGHVHRAPDLFLSHSSRDKHIVRTLAEDLAFCEVDSWLDEWEIQIGESLYDVITRALEKSRYIAIVLADNFNVSRYASDEMKQALARERRESRVVLLPLLFGKIDIPPFLEDKLYLDFRSEYHHALVRLAGLIHEVPKQHVEEAIRFVDPQSIRSVIATLRFAGKEPYVVMSREDGDTILKSGCGSVYFGFSNREVDQRKLTNRIRFSPELVAADPATSPRLKNMMRRLIEEVW